MGTFVLIHGAWHGAWCWKKVVPLLEEEGHRAIPITLTGLADRGHLLSRQTNLTTHVHDVVALLLYEDLRDVVLAGHSYGGLVVSGVMRHAADRVRHTAYLDAILPESGEALLLPEEEAIRLGGTANAHREVARRLGDGWKIPAPGIADNRLLGVSDPGDIEWMQQRLTPHPLASFEEAIHFPADSQSNVPGSFALCTARESPPFRPYADRAADLGWPVTEIDAGHDLMISAPRETADYLLSALD
jgi:pimeloyl-ACP methyl ester carboxylesterase